MTVFLCLFGSKLWLRYLQLQLNFIKHSEKDKALFTKWSHVLGLLGSGGQPTVEDILACKELFTDEPYNLSYLSRNHVVSVLFYSFLKFRIMNGG